MNKSLFVLLDAIKFKQLVCIRTDEGELITGIVQGCSEDKLVKVRHINGIDLIPIDGIVNVVRVVE